MLIGAGWVAFVLPFLQPAQDLHVVIAEKCCLGDRQQEIDTWGLDVVL